MKRPLLVALVAGPPRGVSPVSAATLSRSDPSDAGADRVANGSKPLRKVLFIGIDGADWQILDPLIAKGRLPHLDALVRNGAAGELRSLEPMLSPLLWTTMATGKLPEEHGILSFTAYDAKTGKRVPISRARAKWMLSGTCWETRTFRDIVGWLRTFPAGTSAVSWSRIESGTWRTRAAAKRSDGAGKHVTERARPRCPDARARCRRRLATSTAS